jgi:hypothetical protein
MTKQAWLNGEDINQFDAIPADSDLRELAFVQYGELIPDYPIEIGAWAEQN